MPTCYTSDMPFVEIDRQKIYFSRHGEPGRDSLLLLHGAGCDHRDWPEALRHLPGRQVVAIDLPGHGRSDGPAPTTIESTAGLLARLVVQLDQGPFVAAGHSMGGAIVQQLALEEPPWLTGLILIGTGSEMSVNPQIFTWLDRDLAAYADFFARYAWARGTDPALIMAHRQKILNQEPAVLTADYTACSRFSTTGRLTKIALPCLVIGGEIDKFMPAAMSEALAAEIPGAALHLLPGAGHMMQLEQPEQISGLVLNFLETTASARG